MVADNTDRRAETKHAAAAVADKFDADVLIFNYEISPPHDVIFIGKVVARKLKRPNVVLVLVTEGGLADSAFRMMRILQTKYQKVTVAVGGWCKSAGTLMCIGAHELYIGDGGELGPLDVQIVKSDELDEQKSGLVADAAFEKLQREASKFLIQFVRDIGTSEYRITLKTASDIATKMTIGVLAPIFEKLEPVTIGEDYRSNRLAQAYAERLNVAGRNLKRTNRFDALENLLSGYPSHGFVIDLKEAKSLFSNVEALTPELTTLLQSLGTDGIWPKNSRQGGPPRSEFLSDEQEAPQELRSRSGPRRRSESSSPVRAGNGSRELPGNPSRRGAKGESKTAAATTKNASA